MSVPLPASGRFLDSIRQSCAGITAANDITIDKEAIHRLLQSPAFLESFQALNISHGIAMPLKFPNVLVELNLICVLALLNFGSGYRVPLHAATGRGAYDNIRALVFALYLSSSESSNSADNLLCARGMQTVSRERVAELMNISLHQESSHPTIPGLVVGELGGPLLEFVELIAKTLKDTGASLERYGYPDLGSLVLEGLQQAQGSITAASSAEPVLERLIKAIPAFQDMTAIGDYSTPLYLFKKALFLVHAIRLRYRSFLGGNDSFSIPATTDLPVFADNVLPSLLVHLGIINLTTSRNTRLKKAFTHEPSTVEILLSAASMAEDIQSPKSLSEGPILSAEDAYILRAAAVTACETALGIARSIALPNDQELETAIRSMTEPELDGWLWSISKKRADYRSLPRFAERMTPFF